jgi:phosphomannomutase
MSADLFSAAGGQDAAARIPAVMSASGSLKFGTSGLRGLVTELLGLQSRAYSLAFARHMLALLGADGVREILIGRDLRSSSPAIMADCAAAIHFCGLTAVDCGELSTPALALEAQHRGSPAIMVTGSHIPDDRNGLKFYRPDGEITKVDELAILAEYQRLAPDELSILALTPSVSEHAGDGPVRRYVERYLAFLGAKALEGMRVGVYQHSSVSRDILVEILAGLGAVPVPLGRSAHFIPVDTEAYDPGQSAMIERWAEGGRFAAIVSTDGDADRPLVADENGAIIRGDVLGLLTADFLSFDTIVTPITSGSVIERSSVAANVLRTRVGSPYVIEAMQSVQPGAKVLGFEANGGVLLGSTAIRDGRSLPSLPTRDAVLPILAALCLTVEKGKPLGTIVGDADVGFVLADRLKDTPSAQSGAFLARLGQDPAYAATFFEDVGGFAGMSDIDGLRFELRDGSIIHYRASGNAPELRCYVEAPRRERGEELLAWGLRAALHAMEPSQRPD